MEPSLKRQRVYDTSPQRQANEKARCADRESPRDPADGNSPD